jgi:DNA-directed RNA polymerase subunit alpha
MQFTYLSEHVKVKRVSEEGKVGHFDIDGLYRGYGVTVGNALRRVLLSSLPGATITRFRVKGVGHEFSTIKGVMEDVVEISLNLKKIRFKFYAEEPQVLTLQVKGEKKVTAADIKGNADVQVQNSDVHICTITDKNVDLEIELTVERGLGYVPREVLQKTEKLPIGTIALDAAFSPVVKVNYVIENMRVGERTDFDRIKLEIETDGTLTPSRALHKAGNILLDHFKRVADIEIKDAIEETPAEK